MFSCHQMVFQSVGVVVVALNMTKQHVSTAKVCSLTSIHTHTIIDVGWCDLIQSTLKLQQWNLHRKMRKTNTWVKLTKTHNGRCHGGQSTTRIAKINVLHFGEFSSNPSHKAKVVSTTSKVAMTLLQYSISHWVKHKLSKLLIGSWIIHWSFGLNYHCHHWLLSCHA